MSINSKGLNSTFCNQITCTVLQKLPDLILVSYSIEGVEFQGALLQTKAQCNKPLGINPKEGFTNKLTSDNPRDHANTNGLSNRYTYYQSNSNAPVRTRPLPMKQRLRARQVLCSGCRGICNENGDKVGGTSTKQPKLFKVKKYSLVPRVKRLGRKEILKHSAKKQKLKIRVPNEIRESSKENTTPVLKILFGAEKTVIKIPPKSTETSSRKSSKKAKKAQNVEESQALVLRLNSPIPLTSPCHSPFQVSEETPKAINKVSEGQQPQDIPLLTSPKLHLV